ncbi:hypothetical protein PHISCL_01064 [Aspergillus sclerotialis]|uniref:RGS domain-containing protein n=1 Tax=Aspergillus sclerotialis TaxID=2070753 RepID=A0A3A2ZTS7_9EURO|nr:hypothetical protein PHISCL_01064 [Aspergillus sclerotialis]
MLKKKSLHQPLFFWNSTPSSTPELSPTSSSSDSDSDEDMDPSGSRPHSLGAPSGAFCPMRPTLAEVLSNSAPPPYTLSAFMAYLSQNHCLETLEFTLEAKRYRESYDSLARQSGESSIPPDDSGNQHLRMLWQRLLKAYIFPGSPREINLPSAVRDDLLRHSDPSSPPPPQQLDTSVKLIHDLMEESIFLPFLNSHSNVTQNIPLSDPMYSGDESVAVVSNPGLDDHVASRIRSKGKRLSPQSSIGELASPFSGGGHSSRSNFPLNAIATLGKGSARTSGPVSSASGDSVSGVLTDDSGSLQSSVSAGEPMTPPTTPPSGEPNTHMAQSPKYRMDNPWKKMGMKLGFKKRSGNGSSSSRDSD